MYRIRKLFTVAAAHKLTSAYSKCCTEQIHGHTYLIEVFLKSQTLDKTGMILDFGQLKDILGDEIEKFDHALLLDEQDLVITEELKKSNKNLILLPYNPTAENMAADLFHRIRHKLGNDLHHLLEKVRVHESPTGWAEYSNSTLGW